MPHVIVKLWPGKSEAQKRRLADEITAGVMQTLDYSQDAVSVGFEEVSPADWAENVYGPDIRDRWSSLYKTPGYRM